MTIMRISHRASVRVKIAAIAALPHALATSAQSGVAAGRKWATDLQRLLSCSCNMSASQRRPHAPWMPAPPLPR
jgi:hypothetical protein